MHRDARVRVGLELLDVQSVRARVQPPVDAAQVVARQVRAMLREVRATPRTPATRCSPPMKPSTTVRATSVERADAGEHRPGRAATRRRVRALGAEGGRRHGYIAPSGASGTALQQLVDDLVGRHPLGLRLEVEEQAVAQHRPRERAHVVEADVVAALQERARLARRARAAAARARSRRTTRTASRSPARRPTRAGSRARAPRRSARPRRPPARGARRAGTRGSPRAMTDRAHGDASAPPSSRARPAPPRPPTGSRRRSRT